jgi:predicted amidohydrolase
VTRNRATVLGLGQKRRLETGAVDDILILKKDGFELVHALTHGEAHGA